MGQRPVTPFVWIAYVASLGAQTWLVSLLEDPARVLAGAYLVDTLARLFLIEGIYRLYHTPRLMNARGYLERLVVPSARGGYTDPAGASTLFGNLFLVAFFFWPFAAYATVALARETGWMLAISVALTLRQLLGGGIYMDFDQPKEANFGFNLKWMLTLVLMIPIGIAAVIVTLAGDSLGWWPKDPQELFEGGRQMPLAFTVLAAQHAMDYLSRYGAPARRGRTGDANPG
jgi:hypothetical protein